MTNRLQIIALFGTSADPPTVGHQLLLEGLLTIFPKVVTWASDNPMKTHGTSLEKRQSLLNALVKSINNPNLELVQAISSPWTISTLKKASSLCPSAELVFVIGSDLASQIPQWTNAKAIMQKTRLAIAPRDGWPLKSEQIQELEALGGKIDLLPLVIPATSSSTIRANLERTHIPTSVLRLLLKHHLYGFTSKA